jgi:hypothetical protein
MWKKKKKLKERACEKSLNKEHRLEKPIFKSSFSTNTSWKVYSNLTTNTGVALILQLKKHIIWVTFKLLVVVLSITCSYGC